MLEDLTKIFLKILEDAGRSYQDLTKDLARSCGISQILKDPIRSHVRSNKILTWFNLGKIFNLSGGGQGRITDRETVKDPHASLWLWRPGRGNWLWLAEDVCLPGVIRFNFTIKSYVCFVMKIGLFPIKGCFHSPSSNTEIYCTRCTVPKLFSAMWANYFWSTQWY